MNEHNKEVILDLLLQVMKMIDAEYFSLKKVNTEESRNKEQELASIKADIETSYDNLRFL